MAAALLGGQEEVTPCAQTGVASGVDIASQDQNVLTCFDAEVFACVDVGLYALNVIGGQEADVHALQGAGKVGDVVGSYIQVTPCSDQP